MNTIQSALSLAQRTDHIPVSVMKVLLATAAKFLRVRNDYARSDL